MPRHQLTPLNSKFATYRLVYCRRWERFGPPKRVQQKHTGPTFRESATRSLFGVTLLNKEHYLREWRPWTCYAHVNGPLHSFLAYRWECNTLREMGTRYTRHTCVNLLVREEHSFSHVALPIADLKVKLTTKYGCTRNKKKRPTSGFVSGNATMSVDTQCTSWTVRFFSSLLSKAIIRYKKTDEEFQTLSLHLENEDGSDVAVSLLCLWNSVGLDDWFLESVTQWGPTFGKSECEKESIWKTTQHVLRRDTAPRSNGSFCTTTRVLHQFWRHIASVCLSASVVCSSSRVVVLLVLSFCWVLLGQSPLTADPSISSNNRLSLIQNMLTGACWRPNPTQRHSCTWESGVSLLTCSTPTGVM